METITKHTFIYRPEQTSAPKVYNKYRYGAIAKTEDGIIRTIIMAYGKCEAIEAFHHDLAACYLTFEVINVWKM